MKRFFPIMYDEPERGMHFALLAYWLIGFEVVPTFIPLLADGYWGDLAVLSWFEIAYHVLNGAVIFIMLRSYLVESFLNVQLDLKKFVKTVGLSALVMLVMAGAVYYYMGRMAIDFYPISEKIVAMTSGLLIEQLPVFGTLCCSLLMPLAVVGLYYVSAFAPVCRRSRWLGYVVVTAVIALPCFLDILVHGRAEYSMLTFLLRLPIHWIACWTYQKTDTVWAPVAALTVFNLGTSLMVLL